MSTISTASASEVLEAGLETTVGAIAAGVRNAATQFVRSGIYEGKMLIAEDAAVAAAAGLYQLVYDSESLRKIMQAAAQRLGTQDAYKAVMDAKSQK